MNEIYQVILQGLRNYIEDNNFSGVILGLSGGIDSALSMVLATDALGNGRVSCYMMPSKHTSVESIQYAYECAQRSEVTYAEIAIDELYKPILSKVEETLQETARPLTQENIQSRIRGLILMTISNQTQKMLIATGNKSEIYTGYCTIYGDTCGGYAPLSDVYKTDVFRLSKWRNNNIPLNSKNQRLNVIPESIINRAPSAELAHNQKDIDSLPDYNILDKILHLLLDKKASVDEVINQGYNGNLVKRIQKLIKSSAYKRDQLPIGPKLK